MSFNLSVYFSTFSATTNREPFHIPISLSLSLSLCEDSSGEEMAIRNFTNLSTPSPFLRRSPPLNFTYILTCRTCTAPSLRFHSPRRRRSLGISVAFASSGGIPPGGHDGGGGGGGGGGDGHEGGEEEDREKNRAEAIAVLAEAGRSTESLPKDLAAAIAAGRVPAVIVERFLEMEKSAVLRWLMQFGGFKERLLADDLFLAKMAMECGVGIFTKVFFSSFSNARPLIFSILIIIFIKKIKLQISSTFLSILHFFFLIFNLSNLIREKNIILISKLCHFKTNRCLMIEK